MLKNNIKIISQFLCTYLMRLTIAAGVTPGILLAAPTLQGDIHFSREGTHDQLTVLGLAAINFSLHSNDK